MLISAGRWADVLRTFYSGKTVDLYTGKPGKMFRINSATISLLQYIKKVW
jgi:hypothetical protein